MANGKVPADAGTFKGIFSRISPRIQGGIDSVLQGASGAMQAVDPNFREFSQGQRALDLRERDVATREERQDSASRNASVNIGDVFTFLTPNGTEATANLFRSKGGQVDKDGNMNPKQFERIMKELTPEEMGKVVKSDIEVHKRGLQDIDTMINPRLAKIGHASFDPPGGIPLTDEEALKRVVSSPQFDTLVAQDKTVAQLVATKKQNQQSLTGLQTTLSNIQKEEGKDKGIELTGEVENRANIIAAEAGTEVTPEIARQAQDKIDEEKRRPKSTDAQLLQMAFDISTKTGTPFNEARAELNKPFKDQKPPTRILLAALAMGVDVPNPFDITKEQAEAILQKLSKEAAFGLFGALEEMGASFATPTWFERTFGRKLPFTGKAKTTQDALDTVGTGQ